MRESPNADTTNLSRKLGRGRGNDAGDGKNVSAGESPKDNPQPSSKGSLSLPGVCVCATAGLAAQLNILVLNRHLYTF